jgi:hypothetical protein
MTVVKGAFHLNEFSQIYKKQKNLNLKNKTMENEKNEGIAGLGSWTGFTGKNLSHAKKVNDDDVTFSFVKASTKKGTALIIDGKPIAIISKGIPKINDDFSKIVKPKHQVKLCKGVKIDELKFWRKFIEWINVNVSSEMLKERIWAIRVVGRENDYGGI